MVQTCVSSVCTYVNSTVCTVCRCKQSVTFTEQLDGYHTEVTEVNETKDFTPLSKGLRRTSQLDQPVQPCTAVHSKSIWLQQMVKVLSLEAAKYHSGFHCGYSVDKSKEYDGYGHMNDHSTLWS